MTTAIKADTPTIFRVPIPRAIKARTVISISKLTEPLFGIVSIHSVSLAMPGGCALAKFPQLSAPPPPKPGILFVGDSLTCGYGVLGRSPCAFSSTTEDAFASYSGKTMRSLSARKGRLMEYHVVAWSGKGVVRNYNSSKGPTMPNLFPLTLANDPTDKWDFTKFSPVVVVLFLGANDYSTPPAPSYQDFSDAYNKLIDEVESSFPRLTHIVVTCGPFKDFCWNNGSGPSYQQRIVTQRKDSIVTFVSLNGTIPDVTYPGPFTGCDGHPNAIGSKLMSDALVKYLLTLNW